ncbi:MAG TPA: RHS repeat-associated core domain-containing protein, partial [Nitrospira sp.]|nr:RHS repeat-associated core domain-containing protein [Nitrospira sp.]
LATLPAWSQTVSWESGVYSYDGAGNIRSIGTVEQYRYDAYGRLVTGTIRTGQTQTATYDSFGNIQTLTTNGVKLAFGVDLTTNRLTKTVNPITGEPANVYGTYDGAGQLRGSVAGDTFTYDGAGMVSAASVNGENKVYLYTAGDERLATITVSGGTATRSEWTIRDTAGKVLRRLEKNGSQWAWKEDYVYLGERLLAAEVDTSARTLHFHLDHLGSPRVITGNGGWKIAEHTYFPFGDEATNASQHGEKLKFTGHERDTPSLDYMHARYYNPRWGRFLSVDPTWESADLGKPQSWNRYAYVMNNPVNMTDPDGKLPFVVQVLVEVATDFVTDGSPTGASADDPPRNQAEFDQRAAAGLAVGTTYQTYTKTHPETGQVYTGRTSGTGTPEQNLARRDAGHHKNAEGYGPAQLDKSSTNKDAIRGRAQQVLDANGGARSQGGTSGNAINEISQKNPKRTKYLKEAVREFGEFLRKVF